MTTRFADQLQSRAILAGYDPGKLQAGHVLVVGAGALGQNLLQGLALAGVGSITIVDFDEFEPHNATRSPLFPLAEETARHGLGKAVTVAHRVARISTAEDVVVRWLAEPIQTAGDGLVAAADVVAACVDDLAARAWLAERCRLRRRPMVEAGFRGPEYSLSGFGPDEAEACYRCTNPHNEGSFSCQRYAAAAGEAGIVPAIQTTAAVLGGLQAEQVVQWLHGDGALRGRRVYGHVRTHKSDVVMLAADLACPGIHAVPERRLALDRSGGTTLGDALAAIHRAAGPSTVELAEPLIVSMMCQRPGCTTGVQVGATRAQWLQEPFCALHGGPWADGPDLPDEPPFLRTDDLRDDLAAIPLARLGMAGGAAIVAHPDEGAAVLVELPGSLDDVTRRVEENGRG